MNRCSVFVLMLCSAFAAHAQPQQRVVLSDDYTSWLLKSADQERYGEGEALPKLLAEGWTIASVTASCKPNGHTIYVLNAPKEPLSVESPSGKKL
jgi:hypothetical protein